MLTRARVYVCVYVLTTSQLLLVSQNYTVTAMQAVADLGGFQFSVSLEGGTRVILQQNHIMLTLRIVVGLVCVRARVCMC